MGQEKSNANKGIPAIMQLRINYSTIALSSYNGFNIFHLFNNIHFTYRG